MVPLQPETPSKDSAEDEIMIVKPEFRVVTTVMRADWDEVWPKLHKIAGGKTTRKIHYHSSVVVVIEW